MHDLHLYDLATPCDELYDCVCKGAPEGSAARRGDLITAAIETAPLGNDAACLMHFEVWPLKLLLTAHMLGYFLLFFLAPPNAEMTSEELLMSIDAPSIRALNHKMIEVCARARVHPSYHPLPLTLLTTPCSIASPTRRSRASDRSSSTPSAAGR